MIILADENIASASEIFGSLGEVRTFSERALGPDDLVGATVLLVRSVTRVDASLLSGSDIRFVGSATIGTDHIDEDYLHREGIVFAHAPGSNADSVVEYVIASLLRLCVRHRRRLRGLRVGIVGCGEIGSRLARRLPHIGVEVQLNDPPLAERFEREGLEHDFRSLKDLLQYSDVVTLHVPLTHGGPHPTVHLIGDEQLRNLKKGSWLMNTSRGAVVDNDALKRALSGDARPSCTVLDVWEGEPEPDAELVGRVDIATPHIAGYAVDAKLRGTWMLYRSLCRFLHEKDPGEMPVDIAGLPPRVSIGAPDPLLPDVEWLDLLVQRMYNVVGDDEALRRVVRDGAVLGPRFIRLRRDYPMRREFSAYSMARTLVPAARREAVEQGLGMVLH